MTLNSGSSLLLYSIVAALFLSQSVAASQFGFSPSALTFEHSNQRTCHEIVLFSDTKLQIQIKDLWSAHPSRKVNDYSLKEHLLSYDSAVDIDGESTIQICSSSPPSRNRHGLLLFTIANTSLSGGMWVTLKGEGYGASTVPSSARYPSEVLSPPLELKSLKNASVPIFLMVLMAESAVLLSCFLPILLLILLKRKASSYRRGDPKTFIYSP